MTPEAKRLASAAAVIHGLVHACVLLLPPLLVDLRLAFNVGLLALGAAANGMYLAFGLAALPGGWLADRLGSRRMLAVSAAGCGAAALGAAAAPSFGWFVAALVVLGAFAGLHHPSGLSLVTRQVAGADRGRALGIHGLGGSLGEALAPAGAALAATLGGWRYGFAVTGLLALAGAGLALSVTAHADGHGAPSPARRFRDLPAALAGLWRSPPLRWLLLAGIASGFVYRGVLTFLPLHLGGQSGGPLGGATLITLVLLAGMAAQLWGGGLADRSLQGGARWPREQLFLVEVMLAAPVLLLLGLGSGVATVALALCFGFLWSLAQPLATTLAAAHAAAGDHGLLYGVQLTLSFGLGSFAASLGAALAARGGTRLAFLGFGVCGLLQLVAAAGLLRAARTARATASVGPGGVGGRAVDRGVDAAVGATAAEL